METNWWVSQHSGIQKTCVGLAKEGRVTVATLVMCSQRWWKPGIRIVGCSGFRMELEEGKNQGLPLQITRVWAESNPGRLCACLAYVRCWDQFSVPQNKELWYRPQAQQSIVQHCMAAGKSQLKAYKRISAPHCKHALVRSPKAKPTQSKSVWENRNRKDPNCNP